MTIAAPVFYWAVDHGRTRLLPLSLLGAAAGALPPRGRLVGGLVACAALAIAMGAAAIAFRIP